MLLLGVIVADYACLSLVSGVGTVVAVVDTL